MGELLNFTKPHLLRSPEEYDAALQEIDHLLERNPAPGTEEYECLEFLAVLVEAYEDEHVMLGLEAAVVDRTHARKSFGAGVPSALSESERQHLQRTLSFTLVGAPK